MDDTSGGGGSASDKSSPAISPSPSSLQNNVSPKLNNGTITVDVPVETLIELDDSASPVSAATAPSTSPVASTEDEETRFRASMKAIVDHVDTADPINYLRDFFDIRNEQESWKGEDEFAMEVASNPIYFVKNRYRDILPYDSNRVKLKRVDPEDNNPEGYINASYVEVKGGRTKFIAAQAPLQSTLTDFWTMIEENRVTLIVMLCKLVELGKAKCERYWPEKIGESAVYGDFEVTLEAERPYEDDEYVLRRLRVIDSANKEKDAENGRVVHQLHYREWPDHGCPTGETQLLNMIQEMARLHTDNPDNPILVHCSAGCGRTGTIIAVNHIRELIAQKKPLGKLYDLVIKLRRQRSSSVQTQDQYQFLYKCVSHYCREALGLPLKITEESRSREDLSPPVIQAPPPPLSLASPEPAAIAPRPAAPKIPPRPSAEALASLIAATTDHSNSNGNGGSATAEDDEIPEWPFEVPTQPDGPEEFESLI